MIRIVFLVKGSGIGGAQRKTRVFFKTINHKKFTPYIVVIGENKGKGAFPTDQKNVFSVQEKEMSSFLLKHKIDIVFCIAKISPEMILAIKKHAFFVQSVNFIDLYTPLADLNLIISKTDYLKLSLLLKEKLKKCYVLYNPVEVAKWDKLYNSSLQPFVSTSKIVIGRLAREQPNKWDYLILDTLHYFKRKKSFDKYTFVFAGMPKLYRLYLSLFFRKEIKNKSIVLLPELVTYEDLAKFYKSIDIFFQASWIGESFGNVIAESFCFRVPVITDAKKFFVHNKVYKERYDAQIELVEHSINGLYANFPSLVYEQLNSLDKKSLKKLGNKGYQKVKDLYDTTVVISHLEDLLISHFSSKPLPLKFAPKIKELQEYLFVYKKKIEFVLNQEKKINFFLRFSYFVKSLCWRVIEWIYIILRFILLRFFKYSIEK